MITEIKLELEWVMINNNKPINHKVMIIIHWNVVLVTAVDNKVLECGSGENSRQRSIGMCF